ncbi:hypothetical protein LZ906_007335 [Paraclostridium ghonii]|uniref:tetratricopeptide repeat protein n=1 Tax=Paraclostridium ghonii TaxID=29358 RepID=UPI003523A226
MEREYEIPSDIQEQLEVIDILMKYERYDMALESLFNIRENNDKIEDVYFKIADIYEKKGLISKAIEEMRKLEFINEKSMDVKFKLATLYEQEGRLDKTFHYLALAINNGYDSEKVFFYKGLVYENENKYDEAIMFYKQALMKNISYMPPKYRLYYIYLNMNRKLEAENILNQMIKNNSDDYDGYSLKILFDLNNRKYDDVYKTLELAKERFGQLDALKLDYIKYYMILKNYDDAMEIIDNIQMDNGYYSEFMVAKSKILTIRGEYTKAIDLLIDKDVFDEENVELIYMLALLRYKNNEYSGLIDELNKVNEIDLTTDYGRITELLKGYSYLNINKNDEAIKTFENLNKVLRVQNSSNPFDTNIILYRMIALIELGEYEKVEILKDGLFKLDKDKFENTVNEIDKLKILKESRKDGNMNIQVQRDILTGIFK